MLKNNCTILIADDEILPRKLIEKALEKIPNVTVVGVPTGLSAKEYILDHVVDLVITDIKMPYMDGLALASFISEFDPQCPVIIISGYGEFEYAQKAITYGVKDYLLKPIQLDDLIKIAGKHITFARNDRQKQLLIHDREQDIIEKKLKDTLLKGESLEKWGGLLDSLCWNLGCMVSISGDKENTDKKERSIQYKNLLSYALKEKNIFSLGYDLETFYYLILFKNSEKCRRLSSMPEYLERTLERPVTWKEIRMIHSAKELEILVNYLEIDQRPIQIEKACQYMQAHMGENLSREKVAQYVYMSPSHFGRLFKQTMGIGYSTYLTNIRINEAKKKLREGKMLVSEIAVSVGFSDAKYFSEIFRKITGYVPVEYRRALLNGEMPKEEQ